MRNCRYSLTGRTDKWISLLLILCGIFIILCGVYAFILLFEEVYGMLDIVIAIVLCILGLYLLYFGITRYIFGNRKFMITAEGLYIKGKDICFYPWDTVSEIGIYPFEATALQTVYEKVICCFLQPRADNFFEKIHKRGIYAQTHMKDFVVIDYDEPTLAAFLAVYPQPINDYTQKMPGTIRNQQKTRKGQRKDRKTGDGSLS